MQQERGAATFSEHEQSLHDWVKLVRKLRWIGMEDEARRLERALSTLPPHDDRIAAGPFGTD